jgi:hypothetical protein
MTRTAHKLRTTRPWQVLCLALLISACTGSQSVAEDKACGIDRTREAGIAEQAIATLFDGKPVRIQPQGNNARDFQAVWLPGEAGKPVVVITHGVTDNLADEALTEMALAINELGYGALNLQLPVTKKECEGSDAYPATFPEAIQRINAAADWVRAQGNPDIALYGHWIGNVYFQNTANAPYKYWIANGLTGNFRSIGENPSLKILDIYGSNGIAITRRTAWLRKIWMLFGKDGQQVAIADAPQDFAGKYGEAATAIDRFLAASTKP